MRASRRHFLKTCSLMSMAGAAGPFALNLAAIGAASAQTLPGYKALVCLFFYGGNDHTNTFIPYDPTSTDGVSYDQYLASRGTIAIPYAQLANTRTGTIATPTYGNHEFAFHPALTAFKTHWDAGRLAVIANVGPLVMPTTRDQYRNRSVLLPPKLFSHNDQQSVWQAYQPIGEGARIGWGGRIGDLLMSQNSNTLYTCISAGGNSVFLSGVNALQYQVGSSGPVRISSTIPGTYFGSSSAAAAYRNLITGTSPNLFENELGVVTNRSIMAEEQLRSALPLATTFPITTASGLASQLNVVARIIAARATLGSSRQVFLVSIGGFDNHDVLLTQHAQQLAQVNSAVNDFYNWLALPAMGGTPGTGVQNDVTLFTASDFGRTLTSNGDGSDHGWGSHHFVLGGAVQGGMSGTFHPTTFFTSSNSNPVDIGQGNMVPGIAVDQYAATFARWMGLSDTDVDLVLPNLYRFGTSRYLSFLP